MLIFENKIITKILFPLSWPYFVFVRIKNFFYDHKILKQYSLPCKVISVGNIMVGGSGKTPAVEFIAQWLKKHGKKVVILSRGYKRTSRGLVVVSDGKTLHTDVYSAGDEAYLLARKLKDVPVLVDKKRERAGLMACKTFTPDFILLDDGYQYRRLARNIDIVMFDNFEAIRNIRLLPAGPYREPCSSLNRAHLCWFSKLNDDYQAVPDNWSPFQLIRSKYIPVKISHFKNEMDEIDLKQLKNKKVFAFCGIANPKSFMRTLKDLNVQIYG
ncbi:MAG: tetraacyldisaccharide 4'-kinase, partial [Calditrichaeota bacterium]